MADHVIYVMGEPGGAQKIGFSRSLALRWKTLSRAAGIDLTVHFTAPVAETEVYEIERLIHYQQREARIKGEWFNLTQDEAADAVRAGVAAHAAGERAPAQAVYTERVALQFPVEALAAIDGWRAAEPGKLLNRSEAIRLLVDQALDAERRK